MKKIIRRIIVLLLVFVAAVAAVLFFTRKKKQEVAYTVMDGASLPVVTMEFEGSAVNTLHGYTAQMNVPYMRDTITPLPADGALPFSVKTYGAKVVSVSYEIRNTDGSTLAESRSCENLSGGSDTMKGTLPVTDLPDQTSEYVLVLDIKTDKWDNIYYYTRLRGYSDTHIGEEIAFAEHFSELLFSKDTSEEVTTQLESSRDADTSSLGYADIRSSYTHVTWGNLKPQRSGEVRVDIEEMNEMTGSIRLSYQVTAEGDTGSVETYRVQEFLSVRYVDGKLWLIAYERTMDQTFEASDITVQDGKIELGILSPEHLPVEYLSAGDYTAFVADGELWSYNKKENEASRLFSFKEKNDDGIRTLYDQHRFQIIQVDQDGNMAFSVYGYMNRGSHEGECGLAFYRYRRQDNAISEVFFVPSDKPYQVMKEEIGTLSYVGNNDLFYLMFGNSIYAIDFSGEEYVEVVSGLKNGNFVVSEDSSAAAWQEEEDACGGKTIQVFYMDDGTRFTLHAAEGETIRALGFIDGDFVYGKARESDITSGNLVVNYPMYSLEIIDRNQNVQTTYARDGYYITGVTIGSGKIQISRETKSETGSWAAAADDALIQNQPSDQEQSVLVQEESSLKKTTYALNLSVADNKQKTLSITTPKEVAGNESRKLTLVSTAEYGKAEKTYYAYGCGRLQGICNSAGEAIRLVYDQMGVVVDDKGDYIWTRANRAMQYSIEPVRLLSADDEAESLSACLKMILLQGGKTTEAAAGLAEGKSAYEILDEAFDGRAVDLKGCIMNQVLYYVNRGCPVLALNGNKAELILGYDVYKNLILYDPMEESTHLIAQDDADVLYGAGGYPFVSVAGLE